MTTTRPGPRSEQSDPQGAYQAAAEAFLAAAPWLGPEHAPSVALLRGLAKALDDGAGVATAGQFGLVHRALLKAAPPAEPDVDALEALLP